MEKLIQDFPQNIADALTIASNFKLKNTNASFQNVLICGMGGSGIGGKIVSQWVGINSSIPILTSNDYFLPGFVDKNTLVIGSSYSGNTEETLMILDAAHQKGATIIGICSGGQLASFCQENNYDYVIVPGGNPPRSALAFSVVQLVNIFVQLGLADFSMIKSLQNAKSLIENEISDIKSNAKELADFLYQKVGVFYGVTKYEGVLVRARQQFNENSKFLCWHHVIPEMNHNELVGWGGGDDRFAVVFFDTKDMFGRNKKRFEINIEQVRVNTNNIKVVEAKGEDIIEKSLYLIHLVDWASFYLCDLNKADIMDIKVIDYLKDQLSKF